MMEISADVAGARSSDDRAEHLRSLRPHLRRLRADYRRDEVSVSYEGPTIHAYLLGYAVPYVTQARFAFARLGGLPVRGGRLGVGLFGGGPAAEVAALMGAVQPSGVSPRRVDLHVFDRFEPRWRPVRRRVVDRFARIADWPAVREHDHEVDLCDPAAVSRVVPAIHSLDLVVFQNCLNELVGAGGAEQALRSVVRAMRPGAMLVMCDQYGYRATRQTMRSFEGWLGGWADVRRSFDRSTRLRDATTVPAVLRQHLLTGSEGLIPRRNVAVGCLVACRRHRRPGRRAAERRHGSEGSAWIGR